MYASYNPRSRIRFSKNGPRAISIWPFSMPIIEGFTSYDLRSARQFQSRQTAHVQRRQQTARQIHSPNNHPNRIALRSFLPIASPKRSSNASHLHQRPRLVVLDHVPSKVITVIGRRFCWYNADQSLGLRPFVYGLGHNVITFWTGHHRAADSSSSSAIAG